MKIVLISTAILFFISCSSKDKANTRIPQQVSAEEQAPVTKLSKEELASLYKPIQYHSLCKDVEAISRLKPANKIDPGQTIDLILVSKSKRTTYLFSGDQLLYAFHSTFGGGSKNGGKAQEGDKRTPEGIYHIADKNSQSKYHLALKISYPNATDIEFAKKHKIPTGGDIMFHGLPNGMDEDESTFANMANYINWTAGCIALNNRDIEVMFSQVQVNTTVAICPRY